MGFSWTDNAANSSTHIRAVHINELRSAVNQLRAVCNLSAYSWTDNPVGTATHIRTLHFTELHGAIQDVWNCHNMGPLSNWSVGSAPSSGRQVSARDINDLRGWVDAVDPTRALNGLHWMSPVTPDSADSRTQVNAGGGFSSVLILSPRDSTGNWSPSTDPAATQIFWLERNRTCNPPGLPFYEAVVVRLLHDSGSLPGFPNDPGQLAALWGPFIRWCQGQGVYNFVVLNEPDIEYSGQLWNSNQSPPVSTDAQNYMTGLADMIRAQGTPGQNLWLGFSGPSGNLPAGSATWNQYWTGYQRMIKSKYNNVTAHIYGPSDTSLINTAGTVYSNFRTWFPNFPIRHTEYGIPLNAVPGANRNTRVHVRELRQVGPQ